MDIIQTEQLTKYYGRARGILDLDLCVREGEVYGYLGPNGAGKTTTIRTLLGFLCPTAGRATIFGLDTYRDAVAVHRRIGYLPGELALYPKLTGGQFLRYMASLRGVTDWAYAEHLTERLDVDLTRRVDRLSHGNRQKLGLLQAFMHRPDLLVLDEPTSGLDPLGQQTFFEMVHEARQRGQTVFLSSHILPEAERLCDRVGIIRDGRLVAVEAVAALKQKALRRIEIAFDGRVPVEEFERLTGVQNVQVIAGRLRCTVAGPLDAVIKQAARHTVIDVRSEEPGLEETFMAFYGGSRMEPTEELRHV